MARVLNYDLVDVIKTICRTLSTLNKRQPTNQKIDIFQSRRHSEKSRIFTKQHTQNVLSKSLISVQTDFTKGIAGSKLCSYLSLILKKRVITPIFYLLLVQEFGFLHLCFQRFKMIWFVFVNTLADDRICWVEMSFWVHLIGIK